MNKVIKAQDGTSKLTWNTNPSFEDTFNKYFYESPVDLRHPSFRVTDMRSDIQQTYNDTNQWFNSIQGKPNYKKSDFDSDTNPIVKYNLTHGTSLFNEDQMKGYGYLEDLLKTSQQKWDQNHEDWLSNPDAYDPTDAGLYNGKRPEKVSDIISYVQSKGKAAEGKMGDAGIGLTAAFLGADVATAGLLPTIAHWGAGSYLSDIGSKQLGKLGSNLDKRIGSNKHIWEAAGNAVGGLAGWMGGWRAADKLLKPAAWTTLALTKGRIPNVLMSTNYKKELINHALNNNWLKFEPYKPTNVSGQLSLAYENGGIIKAQKV